MPSYLPAEPPAPPKLNTLAVVAFVLAFVVSPAAIALGIVARGQIRRTGESGHGLATAGVVLGSVFTVVGIAAAGLLASVLFKAIPTLYPDPAAAAPTPPAVAPPPSRSAADLARDLSAQLARGGTDVHDATCPNDLPGIPGQTVRCTVVFSDGQPVDLVVTVTWVDGESLHYEFRPEARQIPKSLLEPKVAQLLDEQTGTSSLSTSCAGDLPPVVGQEVDCLVSTPRGTERMAVTTTGTAGGRVSFSITPK
jgi:peptidyl-prolyl cis-trans isomerase B (cyclophilin B)